MRIQLPSVSRCHTHISFNQKDGAVSASLRTLSKTNPTIINSKDHVTASDSAWSLRDGDLFTVGERSFRFEYLPYADNYENTTHHNMHQQQQQQQEKMSSKKRRQSLKGNNSSKKLKRGVPTPLRAEIAKRRVATPTALAAASVKSKSVKKSVKKLSSKKKKRTLPTPLRSGIESRRIATPTQQKQKEALVNHVAQVEEMHVAHVHRSAKKSKKEKRTLPTPLRSGIQARRVNTPAAPVAPVVAALPTPLRTAIDARRVATPSQVIENIFASCKKKSSKKNKKNRSSRKSSAKKQKRTLPTPLRSGIESRRVATPSAIVAAAQNQDEIEEFVHLDEMNNDDMNDEIEETTKRTLPTPLRSGIESRRILTPAAPSASSASPAAAPEESQQQKRALPTPLRQKIAALRVVTPAAVSTTQGASTPFLLFAGLKSEEDIDDEEVDEEEEFEEYNEEDVEMSEALVEKSQQIVQFQGKRKTFLTPSPQKRSDVRYNVHWTYDDYEKDNMPKTPTPETNYDGLAEMMKTPAGLEKYFTEEEIEAANVEAAEIGMEEEDIVMEEIEDVVEESLGVDEEEIIPAVIEEEIIPAVIKEEIIPAVIEEEIIPAVIEEEIIPAAIEVIITSMKQVKVTPAASLKTLKVGMLMEALSFDDEDEVYDWFNCVVTSKYRKNKGVQICFVDADNQPEGDKEWSKRLRVREDMVNEEETEEAEEAEEVDYSSWKCTELRKELKGRDLNSKGRKAELVERLEEHDSTSN